MSEPLVLKLDPRYLPAVLAGDKTQTTRHGVIRRWPGNELTLDFGDQQVRAFVTWADYAMLADLNAGDVVAEGFANIGDLLTALGGHYPDADPGDVFTRIRFRLAGVSI